MLSNSVTLIGNLGSDIQMRKTGAGQPYGNVNIAITRRYTARNGDTVKDTQWFRLVAWGRTAQRMEAELGTGDKILVEGRLNTRSYESKDGQQREIVEVNVAGFQKLQRPTANSTTSATADDTTPHVAIAA